MEKCELPQTLKEKWPTVEKFAKQMRQKLEDNKEKGSDGTWTSDSLPSLLSRLKEEVEELETVINQRERLPMNFEASKALFDQMTQAIIKEAADVGNMAMMIADTTGKLH